MQYSSDLSVTCTSGRSGLILLLITVLLSLLACMPLITGGEYLWHWRVPEMTFSSSADTSGTKLLLVNSSDGAIRAWLNAHSNSGTDNVIIDLSIIIQSKEWPQELTFYPKDVVVTSQNRTFSLGRIEREDWKNGPYGIRSIEGKSREYYLRYSLEGVDVNSISEIRVDLSRFASLNGTYYEFDSSIVGRPARR